MMNKPHTTRGFTLIETLVAILILSVSIAGPLTIAWRAIDSTRIAKNKTIAFYLAQDAVEHIRFQRDTNLLTDPTGATWLSGLTGCVSVSGTAACTVLSISGVVAACPVAGCSALNFNTATNVYTYTSVGTGIIPSIFTRSVSVRTPIGPTGTDCSVSPSACNPDEAEVRVRVSWKDVRNVQRFVEVQENLFNWQKN